MIIPSFNLETISNNFLAGNVIEPALLTCASIDVIIVKSKSVAYKLILFLSTASIKMLAKTGCKPFCAVALSTIFNPLYITSFSTWKDNSELLVFEDTSFIDASNVSINPPIN